MCAYELLRNESWPAWTKYLNVNVGEYFKQSVKFIEWERKKNRRY